MKKALLALGLTLSLPLAAETVTYVGYSPYDGPYDISDEEKICTVAIEYDGADIKGITVDGLSKGWGMAQGDYDGKRVGINIGKEHYDQMVDDNSDETNRMGWFGSINMGPDDAGDGWQRLAKTKLSLGPKVLGVTTPLMGLRESVRALHMSDTYIERLEAKQRVGMISSYFSVQKEFITCLELNRQEASDETSE